MGKLRLRPGQHVCISGAPDDTALTVADFLVAAVNAGVACGLICADEYLVQISPLARSKGLDLKKAIRKGQIVRVSGASTGMELLGSLDHAFRDRNVRHFVGRYAWNLPGWPEELDGLAFEASLTPSVRRSKWIFLCVHSPGSCPPDVPDLHPWLIQQDTLQKNPSHVPPQTYLARLRRSARTRQSPSRWKQ